MLSHIFEEKQRGLNRSTSQYKIKFRNDTAQTENICLFSSYSFGNTVEEYVFYYLQKLKETGFSIAFISTSELMDSCVERLKEYSFLIIERDNRCPDFGSWKVALSLLNWGQNQNSLLLANDSVFGPFYDLGKIISSMKKRYDVWGMTDSYEIEYHLQSYFLYANKNVLLSPVWRKFWEDVDVTLSKQAVIDRYETSLSKILKNSGFQLGAYASIDVLSRNFDEKSRFTNGTLRFWKALIESYEFPFFKREALIKRNIHKVYWQRGIYINVGNWRKVISEKTDYPISNIDKFIYKYYQIQKTVNKDLKLKKRKLLFLAHNVELGGAQFVLLNFLKWLRQNTDIEFQIIVCRAGKLQLEEEFSKLGGIIHFYALSGKDKEDLKNILIDEQISLIFSNTMINIEVQQFLSFLDVPQIVYAHELTYVLNSFPQIKSNEDWLRKNITHFITGSNIVKDNLVDFLKIKPEKVSVVYEFVNDDYDYSKVNHLSALRKELKIPADAFIVGMCGTFEWRKSADLLPVIAACLCRNDIPVHLIWVGADPESPLYSQVQFDLAKTNLSDKVHLVSKQKNFKPYIQLFDLFFMGSREDPFPLVNLESGLAGKPVLCFDNSGGTPEYVSFGTGHTIPYLDLISLREKVDYYYNNKEIRKTESKVIPEIVKNNFTTATQAPKLLKVIEQHYDTREMMLVDEPPVTIMTHIFFDNTWDEIKSRIKHFDNGDNYFLFSISEACLVKDYIVNDIKKSFRNAYVIVTSNIGRDIGGKFALIDLYLTLGISTRFMIFLHDKQSLHTLVGDAWKKNLFKVLEPINYSKIINLFQETNAGIVGAKEHIINEYDPATNNFRHNNEMSKGFLKRYKISIHNYEYISGTIYWLRASIIEQFFKENKPVLLRDELESGNILGTNGNSAVHTWERMFCWIATNSKHPVAGI